MIPALIIAAAVIVAFNRTHRHRDVPPNRSVVGNQDPSLAAALVAAALERNAP